MRRHTIWPLDWSSDVCSSDLDNLDSDVAVRGIRTPSGHPEGYLEAFATLYTDVADVLVAKRKGESHPIEAWIPGIETGLMGMRFIDAVLSSSENNGQWTPLKS